MIVGQDGAFRLEVLPARDFAGAQAGNWDVEFCISGTSECWKGDFDIAV
jgi:hypothetical protein